MQKKRIGIIGAGIAGLSCAYELQKIGAQVTVFEKEPNVGGRMRTRVKQGLYFDIGADHLIQLFTHLRQYCEELNLEWERMRFFKHTIFRDGQLHSPNDVLSWWSKLRMSLQWFLTPKGIDYFYPIQGLKYDNEDAASFMKRRVGQEIVDYIIDAYCAAYQFHLSNEISKLGIISTMCSIKNEFPDWDLHRIKGGMSALPEALASKLNIQTNCPIREIRATKDQVQVHTPQQEEKFDAVVLASTANVTKQIYVNPSPAQLSLLKAVNYSTTITVTFKVLRERLTDVSTVWVPFVENGKIASYINESYKGEELIQEHKTLISVWLHEDFSTSLMNKTDETIFENVKHEFIKVCPWFNQIDQLENFDLQRWPQAMPKFSTGLFRQVEDFMTSGQGDQRVYFCGDYLSSPWIEGALRCGQRVASQVTKELLSGS